MGSGNHRCRHAQGEEMKFKAENLGEPPEKAEEKTDVPSCLSLRLIFLWTCIDDRAVVYCQHSPSRRIDRFKKRGNKFQKQFQKHKFKFRKLEWVISRSSNGKRVQEIRPIGDGAGDRRSTRFCRTEVHATSLKAVW